MPSIIKVVAEIRGTTGLPGLSASYWSAAGTIGTSAECADVVGRVRAFWQALITQLASGVTVDVSNICESYDVATGNITGVTLVSTPAQVVSTGGSELPSATQLGLQLRTNLVVGRRLLKGRSFIGPLTTGANTGQGQPTSTALSTLSTATGSLTTGATASVMQVWHRPKGSPASGGQASAVVGYAPASKFWYLRSRRD